MSGDGVIDEEMGDLAFVEQPIHGDIGGKGDGEA